MTRRQRERQKARRLALTTVSAVIIIIIGFMCVSCVTSKYTKEVSTINVNNDNITLIDSTGKEWTLPKDNIKISVTINNNGTDSNTEDDTIQKLEIEKED